ncbi:hypothetical protein D9M71_56650 [compost metagenome]
MALEKSGLILAGRHSVQGARIDRTRTAWEVRTFKQQRSLLRAQCRIQLQGIVGPHRVQAALLEIGIVRVHPAYHIPQRVILALQHMVDLGLVALIRQGEGVTASQQRIIHALAALVVIVEVFARSPLEDFIDDDEGRFDPPQAGVIEQQVGQVRPALGQ